MTVELTKVQCEALAEFIELNIFDVIRKDVDIDNVAWLEAMVGALRTFEKAVEKDG